MRYRRNFVAGGTYFFTVNLRERRSGLLVERIELLREVVVRVRQMRPFEVDGWVVLPDHLHCIWTLPEGDVGYAARWHAIKAGFSRGIEAGERRSAGMIRRGERGIWQHRYWEHTIRDERDYANHMDYILFNPVKHGLVEGPGDWPYSTFAQCVKRGMYPAEWMGGDCAEGAFGERD